MLAFLTTPVFEWLGVMTVEDSLLWSFLLITACMAPFWALAGYQDWKRHEVKNELCVLVCVFICSHALMYIGVGPFAFVLLLSYLTLREKEIRLVGQADFMMVAHWLTSSFTFHTGATLMLVNSVVFLVCILIYMAVYRDEDGKRWHRGKMMPILPPYAVSVVLLAFYQYPLSVYFYYKGW